MLYIFSLYSCVKCFFEMFKLQMSFLKRLQNYLSKSWNSTYLSGSGVLGPLGGPRSVV